jgi:hypothetical protein
LTEAGGLWVPGQPGIQQKPVSKEQGLGCSSVVERLPNMSKALGLVPSTEKKRRERERRRKRKGRVSILQLFYPDLI